MKYLLVFLILCEVPVFAQTYEKQIESYVQTYKQDFVNNPHSPLKKKDLKNLHFYKADSTYRVVAKVEILPQEKPIKIPSSSGDAKRFYRYAKVYFNINSKDLQLTLYKNETPSSNPKYRDVLFLPFTDETNHQSTYGGGRYIDIYTTDIKGGVLTLDFNKAYNPYCAYSDGYRCPIPPEENDLAIAIKAGEKLYTGKHKK